jgi:hypothetical protein
VRAGVIFDEVAERIGYAAGMRPVREAAGELCIRWFGAERMVSVVVDRTVSAEDPMAVIGTALLSPATVTVNFQRHTVVLRQ